MANESSERKQLADAYAHGCGVILPRRSPRTSAVWVSPRRRAYGKCTVGQRSGTSKDASVRVLRRRQDDMSGYDTETRNKGQLTEEIAWLRQLRLDDAE